MACGIGVCMTCVLPVTGTDGITRMVRSCVDGPVFRGEQVRWDDVGTIPFDAFGAPGWEPRSRRAAGLSGPLRAEAGGGPDGRAQARRRDRPMATDLRARLGQAELPNPILTASGMRRRRARARAVPRRLQDRRRGHQVGDARAAGGPAHAADGGDAERDAQLDRPAGPRHRRVPAAGPALAAVQGSPRRGLDRGRNRRRVRRAGRAPVRRGRGHRDRGQHLLPERRAPGAGVRLRPGRGRGGHRRGPRPGPVRHPGVRQAVAGRHRHRGDRPGLRGGRRGRALADQHPARHGDRHGHHAPGARRDDRRAVRARHPAGRRAVHLAGSRGAARCPDHRHGRRADRAGRPGAHPGRRDAGQRRHDDLPRPVGVHPHRPRAGGRTGAARQSSASPMPSGWLTSRAPPRGAGSPGTCRREEP